MATKEELTATVKKIQGMVKSFPIGTAQVCHDVVYCFLEVMASYQEWINDLQKTIVGMEADIKRMRNTIEFQQRKLFERNPQMDVKGRIILPEGVKE